MASKFCSIVTSRNEVQIIKVITISLEFLILRWCHKIVKYDSIFVYNVFTQWSGV